MPAPTPAVEHALADLVALDVPLKRAARELGLEDWVPKKWVEQGRSCRSGDRYRRFAESIDAARQEHQALVAEMVEGLRKRL